VETIQDLIVAFVNHEVGQEAAKYPDYVADDIWKHNPYANIPVNPAADYLVDEFAQHDYQTDLTLTVGYKNFPGYVQIGITKTMSPTQVRTFDTYHVGGGLGKSIPTAQFQLFPVSLTYSAGVITNFEDINDITGSMYIYNGTVAFLGYSYSGWITNDAEVYSFTISTDPVGAGGAYAWSSSCELEDE
jgi:hypothetical protein